ncbi:MAG: hypothetical protein R2883_08225 [Caldisericia bacterium]
MDKFQKHSQDKPRKSGSVLIFPIDPQKIPKDKNTLFGYITIEWGSNKKKVDVNVYIKGESDGSSEEFSDCSGSYEIGVDSYNSNSVDNSCSPISPVLELDWQDKLSLTEDMWIDRIYTFNNKLIIQESDLHCYDLLTKKENGYK